MPAESRSRFTNSASTSDNCDSGKRHNRSINRTRRSSTGTPLLECGAGTPPWPFFALPVSNTVSRIQETKAASQRRTPQGKTKAALGRFGRRRCSAALASFHLAALGRYAAVVYVVQRAALGRRLGRSSPSQSATRFPEYKKAKRRNSAALQRGNRKRRFGRRRCSAALVSFPLAARQVLGETMAAESGRGGTRSYCCDCPAGCRCGSHTAGRPGGSRTSHPEEGGLIVR